MVRRNKNFSANRNKPNFANKNNRGNYGGNKTAQSILPSPQILQEYEYAHPGTADRLVKMAEKEQNRRNQWEDNYLRSHTFARGLGQLFGFITVLVIITGVVYLATQGQRDEAITLAIAGFGSMALTSMITASSRRLSHRPRRRQHKGK